MHTAAKKQQLATNLSSDDFKAEALLPLTLILVILTSFNQSENFVLIQN